MGSAKPWEALSGQLSNPNGRQTLDVVRSLPDRFDVIALAAGTNVTLLEEQAGSFGPALCPRYNRCSEETMLQRSTHNREQEMFNATG